MKKVRIFVDYSNFVIGWQDRIKEWHLAWDRIPGLIMDKLVENGLAREVELRGITVYASTHPDRKGEDKIEEDWLRYTLDQISGYTVRTAIRQPQKCDHGIHDDHYHYVEKGVDTMIVCDMLALAMRDSYDLGVIVSDDSDLIPSIESVQNVLDRQIVHVGFGDSGDRIRSAAWAHLLLDDFGDTLRGPRRFGVERVPQPSVLAQRMKEARTNKSRRRRRPRRTKPNVAAS